MFQLCSGAGDGSCLYGKGVPGKSQRQVAWGTDSASQADGLEVAVCGEGWGKKKHFWQQWVAKDAMQSFTVKLFISQIFTVIISVMKLIRMLS